jgi:CRISPR-associated protein Csd1
MMKRTEKSTIDSNYIEHRPLYIFGLNLEKGHFTTEDKTKKAQKSHAAFVEKHLAFLEGIDTPVVNAFRNFLQKWDPAAETENPLLLQLENKFDKFGYIFCLSGRPDQLLHDDPQVQARWQQLLTADHGAEDNMIGQCAITGKEEPIARIHGKIKGVAGGKATGCVLVSFKNPSESSYGQSQSYNSNISEAAMKKYTEALNYLLTGRSHKAVLDDVTVLYWAASGDDRCDDLFSMLAFDDDDKMDREATDVFLRQLLQDAQTGCLTPARLQAITGIDPNVDFYLVGLKPNSSRLSVKFFYRRKFGTLLQNIVQHQQDLQIGSSSRLIPLWGIKKELVSPKSKNEAVDPALLDQLLSAMMNGTPYPVSLLSTMVRRVKTDSDTEERQFIKLNDTRMGVIKGWINRKNRLAGRKEELTLTVDQTNENPAYLCGRLFAVLESIQQKASNYSLNRTIRDSYFASASSKPAIVFPKIMRLSQYHLSKIGNPAYSNQEIQEILAKLGSSFPTTLSLTEQGTFMIGYYHQKNDIEQRIKKAREEKENGN